jgi:hypothetical protein
VLAELTDLLQFEADALSAYAVAVGRLSRPELREKVRAFGEDHARHVRELSATVRDLGGIPATLPHIPTGLLKLGVQMAGIPGDDRTVLLAFVSNEWQAREKYARAAARPHAPALSSLLDRAARDEARHYDWAFSALRELGCGPETAIGQATRAFAQVHGTVAETLESFGRLWVEALVRAQEGVGASVPPGFGPRAG